MGDWRENPDPSSPDRWLYDETAPTPITRADYDPAATRVDLPVVPTRVTYHAWPVDDAAERPDGWCEDRSPDLGEITANDGED